MPKEEELVLEDFNIIEELIESYRSYEKCIEIIQENKDNPTLSKLLEKDASFIRRKILFLIESIK